MEVEGRLRGVRWLGLGDTSRSSIAPRRTERERVFPGDGTEPRRWRLRIEPPCGGQAEGAVGGVSASDRPEENELEWLWVLSRSVSEPERTVSCVLLVKMRDRETVEWGERLRGEEVVEVGGGSGERAGWFLATWEGEGVLTRDRDVSLSITCK